MVVVWSRWDEKKALGLVGGADVQITSDKCAAPSAFMLWIQIYYFHNASVVLSPYAFSKASTDQILYLSSFQQCWFITIVF